MDPIAVAFQSLGDTISGRLYLPEGSGKTPAMLICHGAGDHKENYDELCRYLVGRGITALALDMHGHGASEGERFHVEMHQWVADIRAGLDFLTSQPQIDTARLGAFGHSSGGTAVLESALVDVRIRTLVTLDATVRCSLPLSEVIPLNFLIFVGSLKKWITKKEFFLPVTLLGDTFHVAADPKVDVMLKTDPLIMKYIPLPGQRESFFVDTLKCVPGITIPTLVLWGEEDQIDPPETAHLLFTALKCKKKLAVIPGNGHAGYLDRHKEKVFQETGDWICENLGAVRELN